MTAQMLVERQPPLGRLIFNRPAQLNSLTLDMGRIMHRHLEQWLNDPQMHAVLISANGERAFCAGGDLRALYDSYHNGERLHFDFLEEEYALDLLLHRYPKPTISLMDGLTLGGGMGVAQACHWRIVTERARLGMPEVGIGYFPDVLGSYFLTRLPGRLAEYLAVTGVQLDATDALACGLATHAITSKAQMQLIEALQQNDWQPDEQPQQIEQLLAELPPVALHPARLPARMEAIDRHFSANSVPAIRESLLGENNPALRDWAQECASLILQRSPLAMAVSLELMHRGRQLDLQGCAKLELHLIYQWFERGDFIEGVRALIIDKDKQPQWNPPRIELLEAAHIDSFFAGFDPQ